MIRIAPLTLWLAFARFIDSLKKDERGLSGVVVSVLLILVAVLAVILVWQFLGEAISAWWETITGKSGEIN